MTTLADELMGKVKVKVARGRPSPDRLRSQLENAGAKADIARRKHKNAELALTAAKADLERAKHRYENWVLREKAAFDRVANVMNAYERIRKLCEESGAA